MKICPSLFAVLAVPGSLFLAGPAAGAGGEIWVAPDGSDASTGSSNAPLRSLAAAFKKFPELPASPAISIFLRNGIYPLDKPVSIEAQNPELQNTIINIEAAPGEHPVLSGGVPISGWIKPEKEIPGLPPAGQGHVWSAPLPAIEGRTLEFRQLWVSGHKAVRAREPNGETLTRLVAWDKTNQTATIPATALAGITSPAQLEMVVDQVWEIAALRVKTIEVEGTNARLTFKQPESRIEFQHPWPPIIVNGKYQAPFFLANAIQFLDEPGEWFEDLPAGKIYYWPREGEDMTRASIIAPAVETLVHIEGAANIEFKGITFACTTWLRPSEEGHVPLQAGMFMLDAKKLSPKGTPYHPGLDNLAWIGRPPAAVSVKNAFHIVLENCTFEHLASAGLDFESGSHSNRVQGCVFRDIGGNGIQLGKFSDPDVETHVPYLPSDESEICSDISIDNNTVSDCGSEDWGCVGIAAGYAQNISIQHNEVCDLPYTGISVGWGWTKMTNALRNNSIVANYVHDIGRRLGDLGGIYTLSVQPGTVVAENSIANISPSPYVPDPDHWFYLYLDEGSSFITVRDNWCPSEKFLKNANGPGNLWTNNGPQVSTGIKNAAGLEPAFKNKLSQ